VYAHRVLGATPEQTLLVTVLAALPAAQNINTYAAVYRRNESPAREATLTATLVSVRGGGRNRGSLELTPR